MRAVTVFDAAGGATWRVCGVRLLVVRATGAVRIEGLNDVAASGVTPSPGAHDGGTRNRGDGTGSLPALRGPKRGLCACLARW